MIAFDSCVTASKKDRAHLSGGTDPRPSRTRRGSEDARPSDAAVRFRSGAPRVIAVLNTSSIGSSKIGQRSSGPDFAERPGNRQLGIAVFQYLANFPGRCAPDLSCSPDRREQLADQRHEGGNIDAERDRIDSGARCCSSPPWQAPARYGRVIALLHQGSMRRPRSVR